MSLSSYIGRYHRVRPFGAKGHGHPYVLDRHKGLLTPFQVHGEHEWWWQAKQRRWVPMFWNVALQDFMPVLQGGVGFSGTTQLGRVFLGWQAASLSQTALALDSSYTYNSAGDGIAHRIAMSAARTINNVYFFITGYTGTAANVNDLNVEVRNHTTNKPGTTLHASGSIDPASATGWINLSGLSFAMVSDTLYWIVVEDADGGNTDYATLLRNTDLVAATPEGFFGAAFQTTDGWASVITAASRPSCIVLVFADGTVHGNSISASATSTSGTNQRGWYLAAGLTEQLKIFAMCGGNNISQLSGVNVWAGANGPGGSPDGTGAIDLWSTAATPVLIGQMLSTPYTLLKSTPYHVVYTYGSAATQPNKLNIGTGVDANLRAALVGGGSFYWAEASGTADWSLDDQNAQTAALLLVEDQVAVPAFAGMTDSGFVGRRYV